MSVMVGKQKHKGRLVHGDRELESGGCCTQCAPWNVQKRKETKEASSRRPVKSIVLAPWLEQPRVSLNASRPGLNHLLQNIRSTILVLACL